MTLPVLKPYTAADRPWLVAAHGRLYARDEGFDDSFPALVDDILRSFEAEHDPACERGWIAWEGTARLGSIFCVRLDDETAKLRLFLLEPEARGKGLGQRLLETCMGFARDKGYRRMTLWTHESHRAACALYARNGFDCISAKPVHSFGVALVEQHWDRVL
ncbi:GNAT family N-acetyltransferase [Salipiger sp. P9]|uniref:GNAT family N-acetyltransferase n=1 Tax=Salipiger pentaromativorans TaxID=2943193 RepID=UPI0021585428|nr:GNAT family N-acetyltransferase [Salipiger pentaromativorans]MCR8549836.1 GNAT family N-acetyltransferase [Salipiger pentaromativorans]